MTRYYPPQPQVPFGDLERHLVGSDVDMRDFDSSGQDYLVMTAAIALRCGVSRQTVIRWRRKGSLPLFTADRIATRLGVHPLIIWPTFHHEEIPCPT